MDWLKTAKNIWDGVKFVANVMDESKFFGGGYGGSSPETLVPRNVNLPGRVSTSLSRSATGSTGFGDIPEASFYKYAQLQNTVRYLYSQKNKYKTIAKDKA